MHPCGSENASPARGYRVWRFHHGHDACALSQLCGIDQHLAGPAIHVSAADDIAHQTQAFPLLALAHMKSAMDGITDGGRIVRVDDQSLRQLSRRAREAREDQHTTFVVAGRNEL